MSLKLHSPVVSHYRLIGVEGTTVKGLHLVITQILFTIQNNTVTNLNKTRLFIFLTTGGSEKTDAKSTEKSHKLKIQYG